MDLDNQLDSDLGGIDLGTEAKSYLLETAKWAKIIAGIGFALTGILMLFWIYQLFTSLSLLNVNEGYYLGYHIGGFIATIFMCLIYLIPLQYLWKFAAKTQHSLNGMNTTDLTIGLQNLKSAFKFMGISTVLLVGLYVLILGWSMIFAF